MHNVDRPGMVTRVLPPDYPPAALARGQTGSVTVEGTIDRNDRLRKARLVADGDTPGEFVAAVKDALAHWEFAATLDERCVPQEARYWTRIWFEIDAGRPKISIERLVPVDAKPAQPAFDPELVRPLRHVKPAYPRTMINRGEQGTIHARMTVEPDGTISAVETSTRHREEERRMLMRETERTLREWRYPPMPAGSTRKRIVCMQVHFTLSE